MRVANGKKGATLRIRRAACPGAPWCTKTHRELRSEPPKDASRDRGGDDRRDQGDEEEAPEILGGTGHPVLRKEPEHPRVRPELGDVLEDGEGCDGFEQRPGLLRVVEMGHEEHEAEAEQDAGR